MQPLLKPEPLTEMDPDEPTSLEEMGLTPYEETAKAHWKRFLPTLAGQLEKQGTLDQAIRQASHNQMFEEMLAESRGVPRQAAQELARETLFPLPEPARPKRRRGGGGTSQAETKAPAPETKPYAEMTREEKIEAVRRKMSGEKPPEAAPAPAPLASQRPVDPKTGKYVEAPPKAAKAPTAKKPAPAPAPTPAPAPQSATEKERADIDAKREANRAKREALLLQLNKNLGSTANMGM